MDVKKTGTTTLALLCKDGIVMGAESKATSGFMVANKEVKKLFQIDDKMAMTVAGDVSDVQQLVRILRAEIKLYKLETQEEIKVKAAATLLSNIMYGRKLFPYLAQIIVAGIDKLGKHIYSFDPAGACIEEKYVATGSGSVFVYGILEKDYKEGMKVKEGIALAKQAIKVAKERDVFSGGEKIWLGIINDQGVEIREENL